MNVQNEKLDELRKKALEIADKMSDEEKKVIEDLANSSPYHYLYMGYIPVNTWGTSDI